VDLLFPGAYPHQRIHLSFNKKSFLAQPTFVLVYAFYENKLLFIHHRQRGWELPGGTCRVNEWPINAAKREVYEESGAELSYLEPIGQYLMVYPDQPQEAKTIYIAQIKAIHPLPPGFESDKIQLLNPPPNPDTILLDSDYSLLLKDNVYRYSLPVALEHIERYYLRKKSKHVLERFDYVF
jgi:8-oxo-dGTP diphosphatase